MKAILTLNNPLWKTTERRAILDKAVQESAAELESLVKRKILDSPATGKVYGRGSITARASKKNLDLGLKPARNNSKRVVIASKFHRASAPGQPPASDSGGLVNSVRAKKLGVLSAKVAVGKNYGAALDNGAVINGRSKRTKIIGPMKNRIIKPRPFFASTVDAFKAKFKQNLSDTIKANSR
jgi:hypothetical protein